MTIFTYMFQFFKSLHVTGSDASAAVMTLVISSFAVGIVALIIRLVSKIKSFALFGS